MYELDPIFLSSLNFIDPLHHSLSFIPVFADGGEGGNRQQLNRQIDEVIQITDHRYGLYINVFPSTMCGM